LSRPRIDQSNRLLCANYQIISRIPKTLGIELPPVAREIAETMGDISDGAAELLPAASCVLGGSFIKKLWFKIGLPVALILTLYRPGPPGRSSTLSVFHSKSVFYGRAGRLTATNGGFRPGQSRPSSGAAGSRPGPRSTSRRTARGGSSSSAPCCARTSTRPALWPQQVTLCRFLTAP
jgi:hypothetical protein